MMIGNRTYIQAVGPLFAQWAVAVASFVLVAVLSPALAQHRVAAPPQVPAISCPTSPSKAAGRDFQGQTLNFTNFSRVDLSNANFQGATLKGVVFIGANLTGATFSNATFIDSGSPTRTNDFSFATLDFACFMGAKFQATTYLTYASLTCADFSRTDLTDGNAIFGDEPLRYRPVSDVGCVTAFRQSKMSCEFVGDWRNFDLSDAIVNACREELASRDFNHAQMPGLNFTSMVLDGSNFAGANLTRAVFTGASLQCLADSGKSQCVDMSAAQLQGADLSKANLTGANLSGAFLSNDANKKEYDAASMTHAHLKNVNLAYAQLSGVDFSYANFYGDNPANPQPCGTARKGIRNPRGSGGGCASAHGATMLGTNFTGAYGYGVDFTGATISGVSFSGAVLIGANFAGATIGPDVNSATVTSFTQAYLQGTNLDLAKSLDARLSDAFMDFEPGNEINLLLNGRNHNVFACPAAGCNPATVADVCVDVSYPSTTVPANNQLITCPDSTMAGVSGCGVGRASDDPRGVNPRWASSLNINAPPDLPPAWYANKATYTKATNPEDPGLCGGVARNPPVYFW